MHKDRHYKIQSFSFRSVVPIYPNMTRENDGNTHNATMSLAWSVRPHKLAFGFFLNRKKKLEYLPRETLLSMFILGACTSA